MCDLCRELDYKIETCRRLENSTNDELTREAVAALIRAYEEDKAKLHPHQSDDSLRS
jgi:U3 small nucleolar RNA-associated protein 14